MKNVIIKPVFAVGMSNYGHRELRVGGIFQVKRDDNNRYDPNAVALYDGQRKKKKVAMFEVAEVVPVMTNNYEDSILKGVKEEAYSYESSRELLDKDVVQLHAPRWQSMRRDVIGCTTEIDFFLWPRNDIDRIECQLFSRWKGDQVPFKRIEASFLFSHLDYERQLMRLLTRRDKEGLIINNPSQTMFLFIDKQQLQTAKNKVMVFKLSSVCLYLPQDQLTHWGAGNVEDLVTTYL